MKNRCFVSRIILPMLLGGSFLTTFSMHENRTLRKRSESNVTSVPKVICFKMQNTTNDTMYRNYTHNATQPCFLGNTTSDSFDKPLNGADPSWLVVGACCLLTGCCCGCPLKKFQYTDN
jgi:hypothetical protein